MRKFVKPFAAVIIGLLLAYAARMHSIANVAATKLPERAVAADPDHAQAQAALADLRLVQADKDKAQLPAAVRHAQAALRIEPGNARALRALALAAEQKAVALDTARLMTLSSQASRRDLVAQIWLVQAAARAGDPVAALRHANVAMRANRRGDEVMIPMLVNAMVDDRIVGPLADELATRPPWLDTLWGQVLESKPAWPNAVNVLNRLKVEDQPLPPALGRELVARMADAGQWALAAQVYDVLAPGRALGRTGTTTTQFGQAEPIAPFDWQMQANGRIAADALREGGLLFEVSRGPGGLLARRLIALQPGNYRLRAVLEVEQADADEAPFVRLSCASRDGGARTFSFPDAGSRRVLDSRLAVAGDCPFQWLEVASPSVDAADGAVTVLQSISISGVGGGA